MASLTALLGLRKPAVIDNVNVQTDLSDNFDKIDAFAAGPFWRNRIRNGDFSIAQRGNGAFAGNGIYNLDGWICFSVGGVGVTRVAATLAQVEQTSCRFNVSLQVSGHAAAGDYMMQAAVIEDVSTLSGKQVTLSFWAAATSGTPKIGIEVVQSFGTGGSPSASVLTTIQAVQISTTLTKYTVTFIMPSVAGKVLGSNNNDYVDINFWLSAGATFAARASNIGIQNLTFTLTAVQLEAGPVATAFERLPQQVQLAWCQRYFYRFTAPAQNAVAAWGGCPSAGNGYIEWKFPVTMRAVPTFASSVASGWKLSDRLAEWVCSSIAVQTASVASADLVIVVVSGTMTVRAATVMYAVGAGSYLEATAEL